MPIFEVTKDHLFELRGTTFSAHGLRERADLQRLLRDQIDVIDPDVLVVSEEFGGWEDSKRRIDLLARPAQSRRSRALCGEVTTLHQRTARGQAAVARPRRTTGCPLAR